MIIAIDGFSSVGKSSVSLEVAKRLGIIHLNSGAIYRAIGVFCENSKINPSEITYEDCVNSKIELTFFAGKQQTLLNKEDVSLKIKDKKYSHLASVVGTVFVVHEYINEIIRKFTQNKSIVADGRDMGTNVFPDANFKFFLSA
ncbi:MAG: (d)CMP kinase, partial [Clostridia bacterium]